MAQRDWKKYCFPVYERNPSQGVDRAPQIYMDKNDAYEFGRFKGRIIGIWHVRGKTPEVQRALWRAAK